MAELNSKLDWATLTEPIVPKLVAVSNVLPRPYNVTGE